MHKKLFLLLSALGVLLVGCFNQPYEDEIVVTEGAQWGFILQNCPEGYNLTLINDVDGVGTDVVQLRGQDEPLRVGDKIIRTADCGEGRGELKYHIGDVLKIEGGEVTIGIYLPAIQLPAE